MLRQSVKSPASWWSGLVLLLALALGPSWHLAADAGTDTAILHADLTPGQADRARKLKGEVMAPCCWHGTVDSHNSPISNKIAAEIEQGVADGKPNAEILEALVGTYGERILASPRKQGLGLAFYVLPAAAVAGAGVLLSLWLKRNSRDGGGTERTLPESAARPIPAPGAGTGSKHTADSADSAGGDGDDWSRRFEQELRHLDGDPG